MSTRGCFRVLVCGLALLLLVGNAEAGQLRIAWDPNLEPEVVGYLVSYGTAAGQYDRTVDAGFQTDCTLEGLSDGQIYYVAVQAYTADQVRSDYSTEVSAVVRPTSTPLTNIDTPRAGTVVAEPFVVAGWALDLGASVTSGVDAVHVYGYPSSGGPPVFLGSAPYGGSRPDVAIAFGSNFGTTGFFLTVNNLASGSYSVVAYGHSTITGGFQTSLPIPVTVVASGSSHPVLAVDTPTAGATVGRPFTIAGWAADLGASAGSGIDALHVLAYLDGGAPVFAGTAALGGARPDVAAILGSQFASSGFSVAVADLAPGNYLLVVYPHSAVSGTFGDPATVRVTVTAPAPRPLMSIDTPGQGTTLSGGFALGGWAVDAAAGDGPGVDAIHVWAYPNPGSGANPIFVGVAAYGGARPDVGAILGQNFTASGFNPIVQELPAGVYDLVVYAHSTLTGTFNNAAAVRVTVH